MREGWYAGPWTRKDSSRFLVSGVDHNRLPWKDHGEGSVAKRWGALDTHQNMVIMGTRGPGCEWHVSVHWPSQLDTRHC